ncbi:MAG: hypothetical protein M1404_05775 [Acidobacteria bacterium]|nr:hypothetical protein [Acidobacteriota bacterium]
MGTNTYFYAIARADGRSEMPGGIHISQWEGGGTRWRGLQDVLSAHLYNGMI